MADEKQLEILKQGVEAWNQWRKDNPQVRVHLERADLIVADLRGAKLMEADLSLADLGGAILSRAILREANLRKANLIGANLTEANLRKANLRGASFWGANLTETNLRGADLRDADLEATKLLLADLRDANLEGANLILAALGGANLSLADLRKADLREGNLRGANLTAAILGGANFTHNGFGATTFGDNDLSSALGLETVRHLGPSTIGTDTIRKSKGKIPIEFLRGCGLSDLEIESAKLATPGLDPEQVTQITYEIYRLYCDQPIQFYSCFISYNSKDHKFAQRLHDDLQNNGVRCWFAPEDLKIGDEFRKVIGTQIRVRDKLLIILSENSIQSEWVGDEVEKALAEEKEQSTLKLFPIRLDNAVLKAKDDWAEKIRLRRHIGDFSKEYEPAFERLLRDLKPQ